MEPLLPDPPNPTHGADWRLAQRARLGHPSAWMELVRSAQGVVMGLLVRHIQPQEREDLFQEVWLRVHRYLDSYRGESALGTWVYQVTMNVIRTHWSDTQRRRSREVLATDWQSAVLGPEDALEEAWDVPVAPGQPFDQEQALADLERQAALGRLRQLIANLKPLDRQVLFLRDVDGCPYEEIAARLQVPMGTVKSRLARARAHLAQALQGQRGRTPQAPAGPASSPVDPGRAPAVLPVRKA